MSQNVFLEMPARIPRPNNCAAISQGEGIHEVLRDQILGLLICNQCSHRVDLTINLIVRIASLAQMKGERLLCDFAKRHPTKFAHKQIKQFLMLLFSRIRPLHTLGDPIKVCHD